MNNNYNKQKTTIHLNAWMICSIVLIFILLFVGFKWQQANNEITQLNSDVDSLNSKISLNQHVIDNLNIQIVDFSSQLSSKQSELSAINTQLTNTQSQLSSKNTELSALNNQLSNLNSQIQSKNTQITNLTNQINDLQSQITNLNQQINDLQSQIVELKQQINNLNSQVNSLNSQISNLNQQITTLQNQNISLNVNLSRYTEILRGLSISLENISSRPTLIDNPNAHNPTWHELLQFLISDNTETHQYIENVYDCTDFSNDLHNNAERYGIKCAVIHIDFSDVLFYSHALNAFITTDYGIVYIESMGTDCECNIISRQVYRAYDIIYSEITPRTIWNETPYYYIRNSLSQPPATPWSTYYEAHVDDIIFYWN